MELLVGKSYRIKKDVFALKKGEIWTLTDQGYQAYYGERNFRFINSDKDIRFMVLRDAVDTDFPNPLIDFELTLLYSSRLKTAVIVTI